MPSSRRRVGRVHRPDEFDDSARHSGPTRGSPLALPAPVPGFAEVNHQNGEQRLSSDFGAVATARCHSLVRPSRRNAPPRAGISIESPERPERRGLESGDRSLMPTRLWRLRRRLRLYGGCDHGGCGRSSLRDLFGMMMVLTVADGCALVRESGLARRCFNRLER
jgi:hypothetical protein